MMQQWLWKASFDTQNLVTSNTFLCHQVALLHRKNYSRSQMYLCHTKEEKCKVFFMARSWVTVGYFENIPCMRYHANEKFESLSLQASGG